MNKLERDNAHAITALQALRDGQYFVVVLEDYDIPMGAPVAPPRGAAFVIDGKWMVFSPMEAAN